MIVHNNVPAIVATRMQGACRVTCTVVDMFDAPDISAQACYFCAMGDADRLEMLERQRLAEDGEPESIFERKSP